MGFNTTSLPTYVEQRRLPFIKKAVLGAQTLRHTLLQTDIKTSAALNLLNTQVAFQDGSTCGFTPQGTTNLSQRMINTGWIKVNMDWCDKDLLDYWTQYEVRMTVEDHNLPFEEEFVADIIRHVNAMLEKAIWQGDTASEDPNLARFDGFLKILNAASAGTIKATWPAGASAYEKVQAVAAAIPTAVLAQGNTQIFVGSDMLRQVLQDMVKLNYYHYTAGEGASNEYRLPATDIRVIGVDGLDGTGAVIGGARQNFIFGTDLVNNREDFKLWYSQDSELHKFKMLFNAGVQVAYPDEIVVGSEATAAAASVPAPEEAEA